MQGIFAGLTGAAKVSGAGSSEPSSQTVRSSKAPVRFILGRASTGGVLAWIQEQPGDQTSGEWLHIVYVLSEGAIAGVDQIYVDERPLSELGENATSEVIIDPAQVNAFLLANCPDWRQEQIGRGLSFVRLSFKYDAEKFPSGIPDVRFVVRGRRDIYDPRNGSSGYSANTALLILWYLRNRCGIPDDEIIFQSFASAANVSDEAVGGPDGTVTPRYFAGAVIGADEKRNTVLDNLLSACAGTLIRVGGRWSLQVGAYYGPADFTINEDMVIGTVEGTTEVSNSDAINTMRGTFVDPAQAWAETDYPEVAIQDWITADGGELAESQSFAYVTDAYLAQRLANISLRRRRSGGSVSMPLNFNGYNCRPGRAVKVDLPSLNILGEFMVTEWTMGAADACKVTLKPYEQAIFDDAVGQPYDPLGFINLPVGGLAAVTGLAWTPSSVAEIIQGVLSWVSPAQTVLSYTVTIRKGTEVVQSLKVGGDAASCNINGLASGTYAMSVVAFGPGTRSGEASINVNVGGPPVPESCDYFASVDSITLVPVNRQNSLNGGTYEYFHATNPQAPIADAVYLGQGLTFTHTGLAFAKQYFYYVRSANAYGKSDFLYVAAATSDDPTQMLEVIKGEILESHLGQQLTEKIDLIDGNGPGSVNERVESARSELSEQVAEVNNVVAAVSNSVTAVRDNLQQQVNAVGQEVGAAKADLQQKIDAVSVLAGSLPYNNDKTYTTNQGVLGADGKLYQAVKAVPKSTPPPNATYWTDVGQAIVTAAGTASRVSKVETDVSTLDGKTTAQATQIGGLQSSLTTTNQNVTTAQQAADAANTLAGGKGKVIIQLAAPAAADRLAQNLWIDTTGNANTPKRWNGTTWVAVTDKAATDAAAAAQSALSQVALKADATVVNNVATRVSEAEGKLSSQASRMDGMQTSIDGKASSQALQQVTTRVTATEQKDATQDQQLTSQSQALTSLTDSVSKKAEASAVQSMGNTVSQQGQTLAALGQSLTRIDAALPLLSGENLLPNSSFEDPASSGRPKHWVVTGSAARSLVPSPLTSSVNALRVSASIAAGAYVEVVSTADDGRARVKVTGGSAYTLSVYARGGAPGLMRMYIQFLDAAGAVLSAPWTVDGFPLTETFGRYVLTGTAPAAATQANIYAARLFNTGTAAASLWMEIDNAQLQEGTVATAYQPSVLAASEVSAEATSALSARVDKNEQGITSTSVQVTQLGGKLDTTNQSVTNAQQAAQAASDAAGAKGKVLYQSATPAVADRLTQNLWIDTTGNANTPKRWNGTAWVAVTDKVATDAAAAAQDALSKVATKADASTVQVLSNTVAQHGQQITADGQAITRIDANLANIGGENLLYNPSFEKAQSGGMAEGWTYTGASGTTRTPSLVASALAPAELAQRVDMTGLAQNLWVRIQPDPIKRPSVASGQTFTFSVSMRGTPGLTIRPEILFRDAQGTVTGSVQGANTVASNVFKRLSVTMVAPEGSATVDVYPVCFGTSAISSGFMEIDRSQLELGATMSGWRDSNGVSDADTAANAAATTAISGRVSATEQGLSSASSQLTQLDNSIGDAGGENLFYNPTFSKYASLNGSPEGWESEGSVISTDTLVDSWLNSGEKAQRVVGSGFGTTTGSGYKSLRPQGAGPDRRPTVAQGQTVTASIYVRGTVGLSMRIFLQWFNAAGVVISAPASTLLPITAAGDRKQFSGVAPAEAAKLHVYYRVYSTTGAVTSGNAELARPQLEYGVRMTGWRDNGQVNAANNAATSAAVKSLTSAVNQQGGTLSSVAGRTTTLENSLSTTNQNVTTAQQAADAANTLAGGKGKVIIQAAAPAAADRLAQNLWIDTTNNANTPKRWSGSAWGAVTDKAATDAAAAAANALSVAQTKADSSVVQGINSRVTDAEGKLTSQGQAITAMDNSLTVTNQNVTTAQQAAQAAADSAGTKGKVLYQSAAPAVADRLAQNLWIDTTNNANTPKRWSGSAWVAVTDKAATDAAAAAQSALTQVATKAEASALQTLTNRVAAAEGVNTSQSASLIDLSNNVGAIQSGLGASGLDPAPGAYWQFDAGAEGWVSINANIASSGGSLRLTPTSNDPQLLSSSGALSLNIPGAQYTKVRVGLTRRGGAATSWTGTLYYSTASHGISTAYRGSAPNPNIAVGQSAVVEWDMANLAAGGTDWVDSAIGRLRFNFANALDSVWDVDWIAVGRVGPSASSRVVETLTSTVTQQGDKLTAEAQRIDGLYTSVGNAQAAIQNEITARTNADSALSQQIQTTQATLGETTASVQRVSTTLNQLNGVANASEVVKVQITANRIRHVAGFGLSIDNSKGAVQSTFAILADRFAILNPSGDAVSSPFAVVGNQTFISDAYIRDASIGNAKITNGAITTAKIGEAEVDTLRIRGNAVTIPVGAFAGSSTVSVTVTLDGNYPVFLLGSLTQTYQSDISMTRNGVLLWTERPQNSTLASRGVMDYPGPGTHTYTLSSNHAGNTNGASILAVVCKR
ncbi:phage tail tip fiber protein [Pseudomonas sp. NMI542_15]|uniref:phage tail tip fiber protein n=1 Tax=Pseudomonas sp. NMI542_15 TaxID=2903148 RepID=UPI003FA77CC5